MPPPTAAVSHEQLVARFAQESRLKPEWAEKCLIDNDWNYEKAGHVFLELKKMIPPDAFQ